MLVSVSTSTNQYNTVLSENKIAMMPYQLGLLLMIVVDVVSPISPSTIGMEASCGPLLHCCVRVAMDAAMEWFGRKEEM